MAKERAFRKGTFLTRWHIPRRPQAGVKRKAPSAWDGALANPVRRGLFLQLPLEDLDFLSQRHIGADQALDLAHRVQDGGVVAATEPPADFR